MPWGTMIRANNPSLMTLDGTRTFVLGSTRPLVIDPGPSDEGHLHRLESILGGVAPVGILLTHTHADHAGSALALASQTGAPILMGRGAQNAPDGLDREARIVGDGDAVDCDVGPVTVHETPGHAPEHLVFVYHTEQGDRVLFAGDLFLGEGDTTVVSHPGGNVADYLHSLDVVTRIRPDLIMPAHGPPLRRPLQAVARYRAHRIARIEQVRQARSANPDLGAAELVDVVYGAELPSALRPAAVGSIAAILEYLQQQVEDNGQDGHGPQGLEHSL